MSIGNAKVEAVKRKSLRKFKTREPDLKSSLMKFENSQISSISNVKFITPKFEKPVPIKPQISQEIVDFRKTTSRPADKIIISQEERKSLQTPQPTPDISSLDKNKISKTKTKRKKKSALTKLKKR